MPRLDKSYYYIDFTDNQKLTSDQKLALQRIQELYLPFERAAFLGEYRSDGLITDEDYSTMTGIPWNFGE
jgi:hypothetical protein